MKANVNYADKVVILGKDQAARSEENVQHDMIDAEVIFIYKAIRMCNKNVQILTELVSSSNLEFLMPTDKKCDDLIKSPLYAAGEVYSSAIIDTLTCQSYYNQHIVTILQQILNGGADEDDDAVNQAMKAHPDLLQSNLWQIPVPENCIGKTFEQLFNALLDRKLVTMALYRLRRGGSSGNESPYVVTNPNPETLITHRDKAFVLGIEIPIDLQGDIYEMMEKRGSLQLHINSSSVTTQPDQSEQQQMSTSPNAVSQRYERTKTSVSGAQQQDPKNPIMGGGVTAINNPMKDANKLRIQSYDEKAEQSIFGIRASKN